MKELHNLTLNIKTGELKHYHFNSSYDFLVKTTQSGEESQFALSRLPVSLNALQNFLGDTVQLDDIFIDTVDFDQDCYWLMLEGSHPKNTLALLTVILQKFEITEEEFLYWAGYLNNLSIHDLDQCIAKQCIAAIRVPLQSNRLKIYARPFRYNQFIVDLEIESRLMSELNCTPTELDKVLYDLGGVSYDFSDGRVVLFTQNDSIKLNR